MTNRSKNKGTAAESAVVKHARANGFPLAERLALRGSKDQGDVRLMANVHLEVKAGAAAESASDAQIAEWMDEADVEAGNADVRHCWLVTKRKGKGKAGDWWAHLTVYDLINWANSYDPIYPCDIPVRLRFDDLLTLLREG